MHRGTLILVALALALAATGAVGCGGGDEDGTSGQKDGGDGKPLEVDTYDVNYDAARTSCGEAGLEGTARELGIDASSPEEVAEAYAEELSTPGEAQDGSRDGCIAGLVEGE